MVETTASVELDAIAVEPGKAVDVTLLSALAVESFQVHAISMVTIDQSGPKGLTWGHKPCCVPERYISR